MRHLKAVQDEDLPVEKHYIRFMSEIQDIQASSLDKDGSTYSSGEPLRICVCMSRSSSQRLRKAQYVQSDIGFKRVVGFHEFELAALDRDANTSTLL